MLGTGPVTGGVRVLGHYRLYRLDGARKIVGAEWLSATDDEDAVRQAKALDGRGTLEVWDRNRLVIRIEPNRSSPSS